MLDWPGHRSLTEPLMERLPRHIYMGLDGKVPLFLKTAQTACGCSHGLGLINTVARQDSLLYLTGVTERTLIQVFINRKYINIENNNYIQGFEIKHRGSASWSYFQLNVCGGITFEKILLHNTGSRKQDNVFFNWSVFSSKKKRP